MSYIVLARKYRPQTFKEIYSQDHITQILSNAIKINRIAHAYLFTGPRGVGKTSMARILAKSLNCEKGPSDNPCNVCSNCISITASTSTDVIEIDGASNTGVDEVRELQRELFYAPSQSAYKIYIIDEVHMLSKNAFNALLKTLEEPPENVIFIFATTEPQKVLPTIISRCQRFDFKRIPVEDIKTRLKEISEIENIDIDEESLYLIAKKSDGGMRDALSLLDQMLSYADDKIRIDIVREVFGDLPIIIYRDIVKALLEHNSQQVILLYDDIMEKGIDLMEFIISFIDFMRSLLMLKIGNELKGFVEEDYISIKELAQQMSVNELLYILSMLIKLKLDVRISSHPSTLIELTLIKLSKLDELNDLDDLIKKINNLSVESVPLGKNIPSNPAPQPSAQKVENKEKQETVVIEYVPPKKVNELTKEHVLENWDSFIGKIKDTRKMLALYLGKDCVKNVTKDMIFLEFDSTTKYNMVNGARETLNEYLTSFFGLAVKLIIQLKETTQVKDKKQLSLQEIKKESPDLARLIEITDAMIIPK